MTFPVVEATNTSTATATSSATVSLPAGISAGDLLLVFFSYTAGSDISITTPTGWDLVYSNKGASGGVTCRQALFSRVADGGEGGSISVATGSSVYSCHASYRISAASGTVEAGTLSTGVNDSPDAPALSPSWGSADNLWLTGISWQRTVETAISAYPANYSGNQITTNNGTSHVTVISGIAAATQDLAAGTDDPGVATLQNSELWVANTIAIEPEPEPIGSMDATDTPDTASISGDAAVSGSVAATDTTDTVAIVGDVEDLAKGSLAATDNPDSVSLSGTASISGALAATDTVGSASMAGTLGPDPVTGSIDTALGTLEASVEGTTGVGGSIDAGLGSLEADIAGTVGIVGSIDAGLKGPESSISGVVAVVGSIDGELGTLESAITGYLPVTGSIDAVLGVLGAYLSGDVGEADTWHVIAMNLRTGAITEYESYQFNSIIEWNGSYYGANDEGIFLLEGDDDAGTAIEAHAHGGITDHGSGELKRPSDAYVSGKCDDKLLFKVLVDEGDAEYDYDVPMQHYKAFDAVKADLGRGIRARYLQYGLANHEGADFEVDAFEAIVGTVQRRKR